MRKAQVAEHYNKEYCKNYDLLLRIPAYKRLINRAAELLEPGSVDEIIVFGVGTGNEVTEILRRAKPVRIVGVDLSEKMLEIAVKKNPFMESVHADMLSFKTRKLFDKAIAVRVLDHVENVQKGVEAVINSVKKKGLMVLTLPLGSSMRGVLQESLEDVKHHVLKKEFLQLYKGFLAAVKVASSSKPLSELREKNSNNIKEVLKYVRVRCFIAEKIVTYGGQDLLLKAYKK